MRFLVSIAALAAFWTPGASAYVYKYDTDHPIFSTVSTSNGALAVGFQATSPNTTIAGMRFWNFWTAGNGHPISYHLWSDPNNDGNINNAQLVQTVNTTIDAPGPNGNWQTVVFPTTTAFANGDWFYVGISFFDPAFSYFLGGNDTTVAANGNSWMIQFAGPGAGDPGNPSSGTIRQYGVTQGLSGVLMIRGLTADELVTPEPGSALLAAAGILAALGLRARR